MKTKQKNYAEKAPKNDNKNCGQWQAQGRYEEVFILTLGSSAVKLPAAGVDASAPHSLCRQEFLEGEYHFWAGSFCILSLPKVFLTYIR